MDNLLDREVPSLVYLGVYVWGCLHTGLTGGWGRVYTFVWVVPSHREGDFYHGHSLCFWPSWCELLSTRSFPTTVDYSNSWNWEPVLIYYFLKMLCWLFSKLAPQPLCFDVITLSKLCIHLHWLLLTILFCWHPLLHNPKSWSVHA